MSDLYDLSYFSLSWLEYLKPQIKESSFIKYHNLLDKYVLPRLGHLSPEELTYAEVEAFCTELLSIGGDQSAGLSPKTVKDTLAVLRQIFKYTNVHSGIALPDITELKVKSSPGELRVLSHEERDKLCEYIFSNSDNYTMGIMICLFMGLRIGEICALKWEDVSLADQTIHVRRTMQRLQTSQEGPHKTSVVITPPKTPCSNRIIPIPEFILTQINDHRSSDRGFLLTNREDKFIEPRNMQRHYREILEHIGIEANNFHTLRHTFATRCIELGMDIKCLSEILGHSSVKITLDLYVHTTLDTKREYINLQR